MAVFRFFNFKITPFSDEQHEIGTHGYLEIMRNIQENILTLKKERNLHNFAYKISKEMYFCFFDVRFMSDIIGNTFSFGKLVKFDKPDSLKDFYTGEHKGSIGVATNAHRYEFDFVFDPTTHIIAISENSGRLPSSGKVIEALESFFYDIANNIYPGYTVSVSQITSAASLNKLYEKADKYYKAHIVISKSNSDEFIDQLADKIDLGNKKSGVEYVEYSEKCAKAGFISSLTDTCRALLKLAIKNGNATVSYLNKETGKKDNYVMRENPIRKRVVKHNEDPKYFYMDTLKEIKNVDTESRS